MARLWTAAIGAAAIPWIYKIAMDWGKPVFSTHQDPIGSKLIALVLLAVYGVTYIALTAAFHIPESSVVIKRARQVVRL
jgi:hypothetical protein